MKMDAEEIRFLIEACIDYIENHIQHKILLDDLAAYTGISKFYLHRIFKSLTGESLVDYIQSRKLTSSLHKLISTDMKIIDIALEYGFEYEQSYIRAFRKKFGYTPLKVRNERISLVIKEKINKLDFYTVNNSITYRPFFALKSKFFLIGQKHKILSKAGDNTANAFGRDFFYNQKQRISNPVNPHIYYSYTDWSKNDAGYIYYIPALEVSDLSDIPDDMVGLSIPTYKYIVFRFVGFFRPDDLNGRQIGRLLVHMYSKWIKASNFRVADTFRIEYIDTSLSKDNYCELDIYQPVIEKTL